MVVAGLSFTHQALNFEVGMVLLLAWSLAESKCLRRCMPNRRIFDVFHTEIPGRTDSQAGSGTSPRSQTTIALGKSAPARCEKGWTPPKRALISSTYKLSVRQTDEAMKRANIIFSLAYPSIARPSWRLTSVLGISGLPISFAIPMSRMTNIELLASWLR